MKELIFDMDGTIADLYGVPDWLPRIRNEDVGPYLEAKPLCDMDTLAALLSLFQKLGYLIKVVSWSSIGGSSEYTRKVKKAKVQWLKENGFPYDEIHVTKHGVPKQKFINNDISIIVDDNDDVIVAFLKSKKGKEKKAIDAKKENILKQLVDILVEIEWWEKW